MSYGFNTVWGVCISLDKSGLREGIMFTLYVNTVRIAHCKSLSYTLLTYAHVLSRQSSGIWCICNEDGTIVAGNVAE